MQYSNATGIERIKQVNPLNKRTTRQLGKWLYEGIRTNVPHANIRKLNRGRQIPAPWPANDPRVSPVGLPKTSTLFEIVDGAYPDVLREIDRIAFR
jgi:hypothetical protein